MSFSRYSAYKHSEIPWVNSVPSHWTVFPMAGVATERSESNVGMRETNLLSLSYGRIIRKDIDSNNGLLPESFETYQIVRPGDVVLRLTDLQNDKRSLRSAPVQERGMITSAYLSLTPTQVNPKFLAYLLRGYDLMKVFYSMGGGLRQSLKFSDMKRMPIAIPLEDEQISIVNFLDHETTKIAQLIEEQQALIDLMREKRQAVVSKAVLNGIDPGTVKKDSGAEWLGKVPAHWDVIRLKHLVVESVAGPYGASLTKDMYSSMGYRVYGQQQVIPDDFSVGDYFISDEKYEEMRRYTVFEGDVLISVMGTIGKVAVVPAGFHPGIINPRLVRYRCGSRIFPRFLQAILLSKKHQEHLAFEAKGSTMDGLNMATLSRVPIPTPPKHEQLEILNFLVQKTTDFDKLIGDAECAIKLLDERRSALIIAAVTGKIDVRSWRKQKELEPA